ncbi:hypothetical protein C808_00580, partial [Lachnospiraceae bacterium M18-1]
SGVLYTKNVLLIVILKVKRSAAKWM